MPGRLAFGWAVGAGVLALVAACEREPLDEVCPAVADGELVVSELARDWFELYSAAEQPLELAGLELVVQPIVGGEPARLRVRDRDLVLAPDSYAVFGNALPGEEPEFVDYAYGFDFAGELRQNAEIRAQACGQLVDAVQYGSLPTSGSFGLDGAQPPDAARNDDVRANWCLDDGEGTPGQPNKVCAP